MLLLKKTIWSKGRLRSLDITKVVLFGHISLGVGTRSTVRSRGRSSRTGNTMMRMMEMVMWRL